MKVPVPRLLRPKGSVFWSLCVRHHGFASEYAGPKYEVPRAKRPVKVAPDSYAECIKVNELRDSAHRTRTSIPAAPGSLQSPTIRRRWHLQNLQNRVFQWFVFAFEGQKREPVPTDLGGAVRPGSELHGYRGSGENSVIQLASPLQHVGHFVRNRTTIILEPGWTPQVHPSARLTLLLQAADSRSVEIPVPRL